jgi:hypothetical protein
VYASGFKAQDFGFLVKGLGCRIKDLWLRLKDLGFKVRGIGLKVWGLWLRVVDSGGGRGKEDQRLPVRVRVSVEITKIAIEKVEFEFSQKRHLRTLFIVSAADFSAHVCLFAEKRGAGRGVGGGGWGVGGRQERGERSTVKDKFSREVTIAWTISQVDILGLVNFGAKTWSH